MVGIAALTPPYQNCRRQRHPLSKLSPSYAPHCGAVVGVPIRYPDEAYFLTSANTHAMSEKAGTADQSMYGLPEISAISCSLIVEMMQASTPRVIR